MGAVEPPSVPPEVDELTLRVRGEVGWVCGTPRGVLVHHLTNYILCAAGGEILLLLCGTDEK